MGWQGCSKDFSQVSWPGIHARVHAISGQLGMSELHRFIPHLHGQVPRRSTRLPEVLGSPAALRELGKGSGSPNQCSPVACRDTAVPLASHFAFSRDVPLAPKPCRQAGAGPCILGLPGPCAGDSPSPRRWPRHSPSLQASDFWQGHSVFQLQRSPWEGGSRCGLFPPCRVEVIVCCLGHCGVNRWEAKRRGVCYLVLGCS